MQGTPTTVNAAPAAASTLTRADRRFLVVLCLLLATVAVLGTLSYHDARKTEAAKANAEVWAAWLGRTSGLRFSAGYPFTQCAGEAVAGIGTTAASAGPVSSAAPNSFGNCLDALRLAKIAPLKHANPFNGKPIAFVSACNPADRTLAGAIVLEKLTAAPPGAASPALATPLLYTDPIAHKLRLRLSICDKGAYPVRVAEVDF